LFHGLGVLQGALTAAREQIENHGLGQGDETIREQFDSDFPRGFDPSGAHAE
jgi:hypothetical protein